MTEVTLSEIGEFKNGANFSLKDYGDGYPIINNKQLYSGRYVSLSNLESLKKNVLRSPEKLFLLDGDIMFARSSVKAAGAGQVAMVWDLKNKMIFSGFIIRYRIKDHSVVDCHYMNYLLRSPKYKEEFVRIATGTAIFNLSQSVLGNVKVALPSFTEQKAISSVLGALDDKIDNNRRMNETLEEMARTIFKSWFVDFDPVHAKAAGNAPAHMNAETATLFPSSFGDNGLPAGWKASKFEDLIEFKNGYAFKSKEISKDFKTNFAIFKMGHIKVGGGFNDSYKTDYLISDASQKMKKYILETGDVLMSMTDMKDNVRLLGHTALFYEQNVNFLVNQRVGLIKAKKEITNYPYIYCLTNNKTFLNEIRKRANSGVQVNLSTDGIKTTPTIMPPLSLMAKFGSLSYPIFERIFSSLKENQRLAELRDFLLPKLMSGEIRVKDAEREVEASI